MQTKIQKAELRRLRRHNKELLIIIGANEDFPNIQTQALAIIKQNCENLHFCKTGVFKRWNEGLDK